MEMPQTEKQTQSPIPDLTQKKPNWFRKNLFYVILILCAIVLVGGYFIWFLQPVPLVDENAEDLMIGMTGFNGEAPARYIIIQPYDTNRTTLVELDEEGTQLLFQKLGSLTARAYTESSFEAFPEHAVFKNSIRFSVDYNVGDLHYNRFITIYENLTASGHVYARDTGASVRKPLRPDSFFNLKLKDSGQVYDLYDLIMELAEKHAANTVIVE